MVAGHKAVSVAEGASEFGRLIVRALLAKGGMEVRFLTRAEALKDIKEKEIIDELVKLGAKHYIVDYSNLESLKKAMCGSYFIISALGPMPMNLGKPQWNLIEASKAIGAEYFLPYEFSVDFDKLTEEKFLAAEKLETLALLEKYKMPYSKYNIGFFMDTFLSNGFLGIDFIKGTAEIVGDGNCKFSMTHRADIAKWIAEMAFDLPKYKSFKKLNLSGETLSMKEAFDQMEKILGKRFQITYITPEEARKKLACETDCIKKASWNLRLIIAEGKGLVEPTCNKEFMNIKPTLFKEYLEKEMKPLCC